MPRSIRKIGTNNEKCHLIKWVDDLYHWHQYASQIYYYINTNFWLWQLTNSVIQTRLVSEPKHTATNEITKNFKTFSYIYHFNTLPTGSGWNILCPYTARSAADRPRHRLGFGLDWRSGIYALFLDSGKMLRVIVG